MNPRGPWKRQLSHLLVASIGFAGIVLAPACIAWDSGITLEKDKNEHSVRIIERITLNENVHSACANNDEFDLDRCPLPADALPHLFDNSHEEFQFCICESGERDGRLLRGLEFYFEDQDALEESRADASGGETESDLVLVPEDELFAALLLDVHQDPKGYKASAEYTDQLDPSIPLRDATDVSSVRYASRSPQRPATFVRRARVSTLDLCNPDNHPLSPGWHTMTVLVTDRPWVTNAEGQAHFGVPDISAGATYDTAHYTFHCTDAVTDPEVCDCEAR